MADRQPPHGDDPTATTVIPHTYTVNDEIPVEMFGKDHWSVLGYVETKIVDFGFRIKGDPHMRTNLRRNWRIAEHGSKRGSSIRFRIADGGPYPTRLRGGSIVEGHDDWECLVDLIRVGILKTRGAPDLGKKVSLTKYGSRVVAALRAHKANGGAFGTFTIDMVGGEA